MPRRGTAGGDAFAAVHRRSLEDRDAFWAEQAQLIDWQRPFESVCDASRPPFVRWFAGGTTNLCHNAVDRHLATRADQRALIYVSTETGIERVYSFKELHEEVQRMAAILLALGVTEGDRVLVYMPMIPEAAFAMLACARIGAVHSVVFGGFASVSLASRIDDAEPKLIVSADAGSRAGKVIAYKPLLDDAIALARHKPARLLLVDRGLAAMPLTAGRDELYAALRERHVDARVPCVWLDATHPSYTLYTSGTTGQPKGVQRDTGGYAVALAASMKHIFCAPREGAGRNPASETFFSTSDIGWVVGHSYIVYAPLIAGMATLMYEGLPIRPDAGIWWKLVERYRVTVMFTAPTAIRVLKRQDPKHLREHDLSSLRTLFLAGEPLDEPTAAWIGEAIGKPIIDNYWQTESGWPILTIANGIAPAPSKFGSPGVAMYGFDVRIVDELTGRDIVEPNQKGVVVIEGPTPPGFMQTVWRDDARFIATYWNSIPGRTVYNTFDWGIRDAEGYFFILGRTDDVINVAGHRLGTREIEESISSHPNVAEVAVIGVADALKGQVPVAFVIAKDSKGLSDASERLRFEGDIMKTVDRQLGALARPSRVHVVSALPKTRSGKLLRRALQAICEGREAGDLTTIEDASALDQVRDAVRS
ncbi:MAG: propionate--CoA ligase [Pseudomonadota bacterium]|nr:propionate--CoA ligase [Pseudomonadota bacterium]